MDQEAEKQVVSRRSGQSDRRYGATERKKEQDRDCLLCPPEGTDAILGIQEGRMANRQRSSGKRHETHREFASQGCGNVLAASQRRTCVALALLYCRNSGFSLEKETRG